MKSLRDLLIELHNPELVFALGCVSVAHGDRARARQKLKEAEAVLQEARSNKAQGARFYLNGYHFDYRFDEAMALLMQLVEEKRSKEKYFKKLCYEYVEAGGQRSHIDEMIEILTSVAA